MRCDEVRARESAREGRTLGAASRAAPVVAFLAGGGLAPSVSDRSVSTLARLTGASLASGAAGLSAALACVSRERGRKSQRPARRRHERRGGEERDAPCSPPGKPCPRPRRPSRGGRQRRCRARRPASRRAARPRCPCRRGRWAHRPSLPGAACTARSCTAAPWRRTAAVRRDQGREGGERGGGGQLRIGGGDGGDKASEQGRTLGGTDGSEPTRRATASRPARRCGGLASLRSALVPALTSGLGGWTYFCWC